MTTATLELGYVARPHFVEFHKRKERFACLVCHRRAGKTVACVHDLLDGALRCEKIRPRFAYVAPFLKQAKSVAWDYLRAAVSPLRDVGATVNESELRVDLPNGSQVRLFGSDNIDSLRGIYLDGLILDEYASIDPGIIPVVSPTLAERQGWVAYIGTPKGHNAFYDVYRRSLGYDENGIFDQGLKDEWYSLTLKASETNILTDHDLLLQQRLLTDSEYRAEFECDFEAAVVGAYFGKPMAALEKEGQICAVPYQREAQVFTAWDLGFRDATAVWFAQRIGKEIHIIDFYQSTEATVEDDVRAILAKPYNYSSHIVPHDAFGTNKHTGRTTADLMGSLGLRNVVRCPDHRVEDGISKVQLTLPTCWFDVKKTARGVEALKLYRSEFDERLKIFSTRPLHDWTSHAADAFRYLVMGQNAGPGPSFWRSITYPKKGYV
jgi:hypothetical protein